MDETSDIYQRKQKIRERYKGVNEELLDCIPSIPQEDFFAHLPCFCTWDFFDLNDPGL